MVVTTARRVFPRYARGSIADVGSIWAGGRDQGHAKLPAAPVAVSMHWPTEWRAIAQRSGQAAEAVLIVDWRVPSPDLDSGSYQMNALIDLVVETGTPVHFVGTARAWEVSSEITRDQADAYREKLEAKGVTVVEGGTAALAHLMEHGGSFHTTILSRPGVAADALALVRSYCPNARVLYDTVDLHWVRFARGAAVAATE